MSRHMASWLIQRDNPDVLLLVYEDMKVRLSTVVSRIANFICIDADDALLDLDHLSSVLRLHGSKPSPS